MIWQSSRNKKQEVVSYPNPIEKQAEKLVSFTSSNLLKQAKHMFSTLHVTYPKGYVRHNITSYV
ncbi:hypothetical protein, partial [Methylophilus aquaticus]